MATYGYARVSTDDQNAEGQILALRQAGCKPGHIFTDHGLSGAYIERPQLQKCLRRVERGDVLIVCALDRLGRNTKDLLATVDDLQRRGVNFRSLRETHIDTTTATGTLIFHVFAALSQFERGLIVERTSAGRARAKAKGKKFGAPLKLTASQKSSALHQLARGIPCEAIAKDFHVSRSTLYRALKTLPRLITSRPDKPREGDRHITQGEALWQLVSATDPEAIRVLENREGCTQAGAVDYLIEETCWSEFLPKFAGGLGTPQERRAALIQADRDATSRTGQNRVDLDPSWDDIDLSTDGNDLAF